MTRLNTQIDNHTFLYYKIIIISIIALNIKNYKLTRLLYLNQQLLFDIFWFIIVFYNLNIYIISN